MRMRKDSLLIKIIFYNDIAIILTSILIASVVIFTSFQEMERRIDDITKNKMKLLISNYESYFSEVRNDVYKEIGKHHISTGSQEIAEELKYNLLRADFKNYYNSVVTLLSANGTLLGEYGNEGSLGTLNDSNIKILLNNARKKEFEEEGYYLARIGRRIYSRVIIPYGDEKTTNYVVVSTPINEGFLKSLKEGLNLTSKDKVIFLSDWKSPRALQSKDFFLPGVYKEILRKDYKTYYFNKNIRNRSFYIGIYNLIGYDGNYLGSFVLAVSKEKLTEEKMMTAIYIGILVFLVMLLSSTISSKVFKKLLYPLSEIADMADKISAGEKVSHIKIIGEGEIKALSTSLKEMIEKLDTAQKNMQNQNQELVRNIDRIEAIDKLLMGMNMETDTYETIKKLVCGFTSVELCILDIVEKMTI